MTGAELTTLLERLATAWSKQDTELALSCFTEDAVYMEPPDIQLQRKGPTVFCEFVARDGKTWQWHIGNYP